MEIVAGHLTAVLLSSRQGGATPATAQVGEPTARHVDAVDGRFFGSCQRNRDGLRNKFRRRVRRCYSSQERRLENGRQRSLTLSDAPTRRTRDAESLRYYSSPRDAKEIIGLGPWIIVLPLNLRAVAQKS